MVSFKEQRETDKQRLKIEYEQKLEDYISKYQQFYDSPSEASKQKLKTQI